MGLNFYRENFQVQVPKKRVVLSFLHFNKWKSIFCAVLLNLPLKIKNNHASIMFSNACFVLIGVYSLSSSAHNNISLTMSFLYSTLNAQIMPWSEWLNDRWTIRWQKMYFHIS
jgi:hypothetical protein